MIGVGLCALAGALWLFRGKLLAVLDAIDAGFKIVEDTLKVNLLDSNAGLDKATFILNETSTMLNNVKTGIRDAGSIIETNIVGTMNSVGNTMINDVKTVLATSSKIIHDGHVVLEGIGLDIDPPGDVFDIHWHPFGKALKPNGTVDDSNLVGKMHLVDIHINSISNTSQIVGNQMKSAATKLSEINGKLINVADGIQNISVTISGLIPFVDTNLRGGFQNTVNMLQQTRTSLAQILGVISPTMIILLSVSGGLFVTVGILT